jgi:hypothetical protein
MAVIGVVEQELNRCIRERVAKYVHIIVIWTINVQNTTVDTSPEHFNAR